MNMMNHFDYMPNYQAPCPHNVQMHQVFYLCCMLQLHNDAKSVLTTDFVILMNVINILYYLCDFRLLLW